MISRRALSTNKLLQEEPSGEVNEDGVAIRSTHGNSNLPWSMFHRAVSGRDITLLYLSAYQFYILPREFFASEEDWQRFRSLVAKSIPN